jgi:hypothetical protein
VDKLYERYGQLMIQAEIINNQIQECKKQIADGLNKLPMAGLRTPDMSKEVPKEKE